MEKILKYVHYSSQVKHLEKCRPANELELNEYENEGTYLFEKDTDVVLNMSVLCTIVPIAQRFEQSYSS